MRSQTPSHLDLAGPRAKRVIFQAFLVNVHDDHAHCNSVMSTAKHPNQRTDSVPTVIVIAHPLISSSCRHPWSWPYPGTPSTCSCVACLCACQSGCPTRGRGRGCAGRERRTLLPAGLLDLGGHAVPHQPVVGLELLHGLGAVVDESKAGALAATEVCLEAEDGDILLLGLVELAELATELILGDVGTVGVEDVAVCPLDLGSLHPASRTGVLHLHNHLAAAEEGVADELARAQGNLGFSHGGGRAVPICAVSERSSS